MKFELDARYQTLAQLHERRKQGVRLHSKGIKIMQIVGMTGVSYPPVRNAIDRHQRRLGCNTPRWPRSGEKARPATHR
jgi:transposase